MSEGRARQREERAAFESRIVPSARSRLSRSRHGSFRKESVAMRAHDLSEMISLWVVYYVAL